MLELFVITSLSFGIWLCIYFPLYFVGFFFLFSLAVLSMKFSSIHFLAYSTYLAYFLVATFLGVKYFFQLGFNPLHLLVILGILLATPLIILAYRFSITVKFDAVKLDFNKILEKAPVAEVYSNPSEKRPDLMNILNACSNILIIGKKGAGKTTLLNDIMQNRKGEIVVIDPHAYKDQWKFPTVGYGKNYEAIANKLREINDISKTRYADLSNSYSPIQFTQYTIVVDELTEIMNNIAVDKLIIDLLNCRKVNIGLVLGGHSDNAADIGLKGHFNLLKQFDAFVKLDFNSSNGERKFYVDLQPESKKRNYIVCNYNFTKTVDDNIQDDNSFSFDEVQKMKSLIKDGFHDTYIVDNINRNRQATFRKVKEIRKEVNSI